MARKKALEEEQLTDTIYYILLTMIDPIHGYGIMQKVKEISENTFEIGPANLYTSLKKLLDAGFIQLEFIEEKDKKTYRITQEGRAILFKDYTRRKKFVDHGRVFFSE